MNKSKSDDSKNLTKHDERKTKIMQNAKVNLNYSLTREIIMTNEPSVELRRSKRKRASTGNMNVVNNDEKTQVSR